MKTSQLHHPESFHTEDASYSSDEDYRCINLSMSDLSGDYLEDDESLSNLPRSLQFKIDDRERSFSRTKRRKQIISATPYGGCEDFSDYESDVENMRSRDINKPKLFECMGRNIENGVLTNKHSTKDAFENKKEGEGRKTLNLTTDVEKTESNRRKSRSSRTAHLQLNKGSKVSRSGVERTTRSSMYKFDDDNSETSGKESSCSRTEGSSAVSSITMPQVVDDSESQDEINPNMYTPKTNVENTSKGRDEASNNDSLLINLVRRLNHQNTSKQRRHKTLISIGNKARLHMFIEGSSVENINFKSRVTQNHDKAKRYKEGFTNTFGKDILKPQKLVSSSTLYSQEIGTESEKIVSSSTLLYSQGIGREPEKTPSLTKNDDSTPTEEGNKYEKICDYYKMTKDLISKGEIDDPKKESFDLDDISDLVYEEEMKQQKDEQAKPLFQTLRQQRRKERRSDPSEAPSSKCISPEPSFAIMKISAERIKSRRISSQRPSTRNQLGAMRSTTKTINKSSDGNYRFLGRLKNDFSSLRPRKNVRLKLSSTSCTSSHSSAVNLTKKSLHSSRLLERIPSRSRRFSCTELDGKRSIGSGLGRKVDKRGF
mmetsp:Transcript_4719/g.6109  ORF Transcript_4719/g.6109 Transcript_4719/m.6109 type:complete len:599 (+) Transcript_4719:113-1909(+)